MDQGEDLVEEKEKVVMKYYFVVVYVLYLHLYQVVHRLIFSSINTATVNEKTIK